MKETTFTDEEEMKQWVSDRHEECKDPLHPPKEHANWKLRAQWLVFDQGENVKNETKVDEALQRQGDTLGTSMQMLTGVDPKVKEKTGDEKHRQSLGKVTSSMKRLSSALSSAESAMPKLKRRLEDKEWQKMKKGLGIVRERKDEWMDQYEDFKSKPDSDEALEVMLTAMSEMQKEMGEDIQNLQELAKRHSKVVKDEIPKAPADSDVGGDSDESHTKQKRTQTSFAFKFGLLCRLKN